MITELLNSLRYKSEGTDIDFKSEQYRFVNGSDENKAEMLKDILAVANAWRDGTGYILLGFRDRRPHPAEVVGISSSIDDASLQQFVHGKVKPKLTFTYEEHIYEGKTVALIAIPKQKRTFYLAKPFGKLKSNVVYVRRGSSTDEAEPPEIAAMTVADSGRGDMQVVLSVLTMNDDELPVELDRRFLRFTEAFPDYARPRVTGPFGMDFRSPLTYDNSDFWREYAEFVRVHEGIVMLQLVLRNSSAVQLSNAKIEVLAEPLDKQGCEILRGRDVPEEPRLQRDLVVNTRDFQATPLQLDRQVVVDNDRATPACSIRVGTLLPGEQARSGDTIGVLPLGPGQMKLRFRILASELAAPKQIDRTVNIVGEVNRLDFEGFKGFVRDRLERLDSKL